jgi:hypothetical protein
MTAVAILSLSTRLPATPRYQRETCRLVKRNFLITHHWSDAVATSGNSTMILARRKHGLQARAKRRAVNDLSLAQIV